MDINSLHNTISSIFSITSESYKSEILMKLISFSDNLDDSKRSEAIRALCKLAIAYIYSPKSRNMCCSGKFDNSAIIFIRFINIIFLPDEEIRRNTGKTLSEMAYDINFPKWLIELRHQISHQATMPSSETILLAIEFALKWLSQESNFNAIFDQSRWTRQKLNSHEEFIYELLFDYYRLNLRAIIDDDFTINNKLPLQKIMVKVADIDSLKIVQCMCQDGFLFPNWRQILEMCIVPNKENDRILPENLVKIWNPILKYIIMKRHDFLSLLITHICEYCSIGLGKKLSVSWINYLLENFSNYVQHDMLLELSWDLLKKTSTGLWHLYPFAEMVTCAVLKMRKQDLNIVTMLKRKSHQKRVKSIECDEVDILWNPIHTEKDKMICTFKSVDQLTTKENNSPQEPLECKVKECDNNSINKLCYPSSESLEIMKSSIKLY